MFRNQFGQTWYDHRYCRVVQFDFSLRGLDLDLMLQGSEESKTSVLDMSHSSLLMWMDFDMLLRCVGLINVVFIFSCPMNIQGDGSRKVILLKYQKQTRKVLTLAYVSDMYKLIFFFCCCWTWHDDRHHWTLQFDKSFNDFDLHSRFRFCKKAKTYVLIFSQIS